MNKQRLISDAKTILLQLKKEERRSINPYASFAAQIIVLINNGNISGKEDILQFTRISYARPRMNRQWRTFGNVLEKNLHPMDKDSLLYLFGYLKRVLTIEGKRESEDRTKDQKGGQRYKGRYPGSKRKHHYKQQR
jgi:hypothetical protein